jgi:hypothetical protein
MATVSPPRGVPSTDTEGVAQVKELNALTTLINEFNGNVDGTNVKNTAALTVASVITSAGLVANGVTTPASGAGVEIGYSGGVGFVQAEQRGPDSAKPLALAGSQVRLQGGGVQVATATSTGVDFPLGFTGKRLDSPYFRAYRNAALSRADSEIVIFDAETSDPNGWYDTATGKFQPTVAGMYRVSWAVEANAALAADKYWMSLVNANGSIVGGGQRGSVGYQRGSAQPVNSGGTTLLTFNGSTDYLQIAIKHDTGGSTAIAPGAGHTWFEGERIGA